jgi:nucleotide-binding universal stress UspA family protein
MTAKQVRNQLYADSRGFEVNIMKILIGYDGSDCAEAALDDLRRAGLPETAEAHILSVAEVWLPPPPPSSYEIIEEARKATSPAELREGMRSRKRRFRSGRTRT